MTDVVGEEDEWLYGENVNEDQIKIDPEAANKLLEDDNEDDSKNDAEDSAAADEDVPSGDRPDSRNEDEPNDGPNASDEEDVDDEDNDDDDDSDDDGVQVVIGDLKAGAPGSFGPGSKRGGPPPDKKGKFSVEDFEAPGTINGVSALEFSVDSLEDKPWRKPGADITDYFNYGFTEDTWRAYCDRQKRLRFESGAGLANPMAKMQDGGDASKVGPQSNIMFPKKFSQQPYQRMPIKQEPHENTIQVRVVNTADRRDNFGRKGYDMPPQMGPPPPFDISVPPPPFRPEYMGQPPPEFFNRPPPGYYNEQQDMPSYEEQQWMDSQWEMGGPGIGASSSVSVVPLSKGPVVPPPPGEADDPKDGAK